MASHRPQSMGRVQDLFYTDITKNKREQWPPQEMEDTRQRYKISTAYCHPYQKSTTRWYINLTLLSSKCRHRVTNWKDWHKPMNSLSVTNQQSWHNCNIWLWQWIPCKRSWMHCHQRQLTQLTPRESSTVGSTRAILLVEVKPAFKIWRATGRKFATRVNWVEAKRGAGDV